MKKTENSALITFSFSSAFFDFFTSDTGLIFARDRIIHIIISMCIAAAVILLFQMIDSNNKVIKITGIVFVAARFVNLILKALSYYETFHGDSTIGILFFTACIIIIYKKYSVDKIHLSYVFYAVFNVILVTFILILSLENISVTNIYKNSLTVEFSPYKLFCFADIFTIMFIVKNKRQLRYIQFKYTLLATMAFVFITILQGLCIDGNILYSISPLQALMQIYTGETIKRYDYIIAVFQTMNYFAAVMLYIWAFKLLIFKNGGEKSEQK